MVPILTILTFVTIIGIHMVYSYAKKRRELEIEHGVGALNPKLVMLLQDGNERFEKKEKKKEETTPTEPKNT